MDFYVINIFLHNGISILMLDAFSVLFGGLQYTSKGRKVHLAPVASLLVALLFAVHPGGHTEYQGTRREHILPLSACC